MTLQALIKKINLRNPRRLAHCRAHFKLFRNERGAVTVMFLVSSTLVLGASFGAMDLVRYNVVQGRLQYALDGATLSAGRNLANLTPKPGTTAATEWQDDAYQYFRTNMPDGYMGSRMLDNEPKITYSEEVSGAGNFVTGQFIDMEAKGVLPLLSTGFFNISSFDVQASNRAVRRTRADLELVMALDNTGSMGDEDKLATLKTAARDLSDTVLGASAASGAPDRVYIGLVPFADTVNVGNTAATRQWLDYPTAQAYFIEHYWKGCIVEPRTDKWGGTDLPPKAWTPTAAVFQPLHLTLRASVDGAKLGLAENTPAGTYERIAELTASQSQPRSFDANGDAYDRRVWARRSSNTSFDVYSAANPNNCDESRATHFLNNNLDSIHTAIDEMQANGNTLIPTGLLWAWRMLHPAWRGTSGWGNPDMPRDPDPKILSKVIVLLTDGQNAPPGENGTSKKEREFAYRLTYDAQHCTNPDRTTCDAILPDRTYSQSMFESVKDKQAPMNSLKMRDPFSPDSGNILNPSIGWGDTNNISSGTVDNYLEALCQSVKSDGNGIKIYTVTLGTVGGSTETLMNNCSSGAGYFYNATTVSDLPDVFKSIAGALTELRLTL